MIAYRVPGRIEDHWRKTISKKLERGFSPIKVREMIITARMVSPNVTGKFISVPETTFVWYHIVTLSRIPRAGSKSAQMIQRPIIPATVTTLLINF